MFADKVKIQSWPYQNCYEYVQKNFSFSGLYFSTLTQICDGNLDLTKKQIYLFFIILAYMWKHSTYIY